MGEKKMMGKKNKDELLRDLAKLLRDLESAGARNIWRPQDASKAASDIVYFT